MDLYSTWSQLAWIDLTILIFSLPVASSNKFHEFQKQPECPAIEANSWILKYAQRMLMELMDQPQVVKEQQLINSNSLITSYKNLAKKYTNLCLTYIPKDLLCSHDEVDMLTSIVNDNAPCLIFSEIFHATCGKLHTPASFWHSSDPESYCWGLCTSCFEFSIPELFRLCTF